MTTKKGKVIDLSARRVAKKPNRVRCLTVLLDEPKQESDLPRIKNSLSARWLTPDEIKKRASWQVGPVQRVTPPASVPRRRRGPYARYTIEPGRLMDGERVLFVFGWDTFPANSDHAGQARKQPVECFPSVETAQRRYPSAEIPRQPSR